jgi:hypothetical protein
MAFRTEEWPLRDLPSTASIKPEFDTAMPAAELRRMGGVAGELHRDPPIHGNTEGHVCRCLAAEEF